MQIPNFTMNELKDGLFLLEFFNQETLLFSIHVQFDIQSEFWCQENTTRFYWLVFELLLDTPMTAEDCYHAVLNAGCQCPHTDHYEVIYGYEPTLLNRYSEN